MKISNFYLNKKAESKIIAFFAVEWPDKMIIRDCKLIQANHGDDVYAVMPSRQYEYKGETKWTSIVQIFDEQLLNKITELAREELNKNIDKHNKEVQDKRYKQSNANDDIPF